MPRKPARTTVIANEVIARFIFRSMHVKSLPEKYWQVPRFKSFYTREIKLVRSLFKKYDPESVLEAVKRYTTITSASADMAKISYHISLIEKIKRLESLPKDPEPYKTLESPPKKVDLLKHEKRYSNVSPRQKLRKKDGEKG